MVMGTKIKNHTVIRILNTKTDNWRIYSSDDITKMGFLNTEEVHELIEMYYYDELMTTRGESDHLMGYVLQLPNWHPFLTRLKKVEGLVKI